MNELTPEGLINELKLHGSDETSADPGGWSFENPLWGHCAVASLIAQDIYGGELMRGSLEKYPKYSHLRSHYWNRLPDGTEIDLTKEQYSDISFEQLSGEVRSRESVLEHPDTVRRYRLLKERLGI